MRVKVSNTHPQVSTTNTAGKSGCPVTEGMLQSWHGQHTQSNIPTSQLSIYLLRAELFPALSALGAPADEN